MLSLYMPLKCQYLAKSPLSLLPQLTSLSCLCLSVRENCSNSLVVFIVLFCVLSNSFQYVHVSLALARPALQTYLTKTEERVRITFLNLMVTVSHLC